MYICIYICVQIRVQAKKKRGAGLGRKKIEKRTSGSLGKHQLRLLEDDFGNKSEIKVLQSSYHWLRMDKLEAKKKRRKRK